MANHMITSKPISEYSNPNTPVHMNSLMFFGVKSQKRVLVLVDKDLIPFHQLPEYLYCNIERLFKKDKEAYRFITSNYSLADHRQFVELYTYYTFCKTYLDISF